MTPHGAGHRPVRPLVSLIPCAISQGSYFPVVLLTSSAPAHPSGPSVPVHTMTLPSRPAGSGPAPSPFFPAFMSSQEPPLPPRGPGLRGCVRSRRRRRPPHASPPAAPREPAGRPGPRSARPQRRRGARGALWAGRAAAPPFCLCQSQRRRGRLGRGGGGRGAASVR